jgi:nucleotidyltransferase/DNA polymerase involved in DNA repair
MPIVCALVPNYEVAVARLDDAALRERPLIVADRLERGHAIALDEAAFALGARAGMTLVQAAACAREAAIAVDDPLRNRALWERALEALDTASPLVEDAGNGTAYLEMRGIAGFERDWLASVRDAFAQDPELAALPLRAALGPNKFVARAAALVRDGNVVHAGDERAFVAPLPLPVLGLERALLERLELFGVTNLRTLAALPHGPFVRRFGPEAARWHALAGGVDESPLVPRARRITIDRSLYGEGTAEREDQLLFALRTLVAGVADDVALLGKRCGALRLELECEDGERILLATTLAQPTAQPATLFDLLRARLEGVVLRSPVTGLRLGAERLEAGGSELSLFANRDPDPEIVGIALARLEAALGPQAALRARVVAGNRYEARVAYEPFTAARVAGRRDAHDRSRAGSRHARLPRTRTARDRGAPARRLPRVRRRPQRPRRGRPLARRRSLVGPRPRYGRPPHRKRRLRRAARRRRPLPHRQRTRPLVPLRHLRLNVQLTKPKLCIETRHSAGDDLAMSVGLNVLSRASPSRRAT